ncbi:MAG: tRNA (guanosine(37)-N1)-methyltransferase TrmD [Spirochaetales bacterium]|nr:tRNA (guanosine(37)-N1)-methyltransferase TrmD [Spirochaetales bacterium]
MIFYVLTLFPEIFSGYLENSILKKAITRNLLAINLINIRDFAFDKHRTCDDYTYGGGPGMILKPEPLSSALESLNPRGKRVIYLSPSGKLFKQDYAEFLSKKNDLILICGRYEGIDQRIIDYYVDDEISLGDYVLASGEIAAMVLIDTVSRLIPDFIKQESLNEESFMQNLLEYPQYTRPKEFLNMSVPDILISGHHEKIREWRLRKSLEKTLKYRPELLEDIELTEEMRKILEELSSLGK